jgi:hypothetical protein
MKHINIPVLCGQNIDLFNIKASGTQDTTALCNESMDLFTSIDVLCFVNVITVRRSSLKY